MLKRFVTILISIVAFFSFAQESKWSIEANFPYTFGDNFVDEGYNGLADLGLKYRFQEYENFNIGMSFNVGAFFRDDTRFDNSIDANGNAVLFQPRLYGSFDIDGMPQLHPMVGLGYSIFAFHINGQNFNGANFQENSSNHGPNLNLAIAYDVSPTFYIQAQYDYVYLNLADGAIDTPYNRNVNIIKVGVGYRL